jgi:hypothetical protein
VEDRKIASQCLVLDKAHSFSDQGVGNFEIAASRIEALISDARHLPVTVFVDSIAPDKMDPINDNGSWNSVLAMLVLAFPESNWVFGIVEGDGYDWAEMNSLSSRAGKPWHSALFDPTGLRNGVRGRANESRDGRNLELPQRSKVAAAIDEEIHYALFHAYTAYRFGYRANAVTSWNLMKTLFGDTISTDTKVSPHDMDLLLEDVNLYFPDRPQNTHLSSFEPYDEKGEEQGRAHHCRRLGYDVARVENSTFRIIVTSGHSGASSETMSANRKFVKTNKPGGWGFVLKPTGGMFDLWAKARLFERLQPPERGGIGGSRSGLAPSFSWPPKAVENVSANNAPHSAPGKLMLVASHLVRRADALRAEASTVEECIRGAVMATEALELLGYRTPTLALQALELKQWFEAKAEVAFVGVGHHFQLKRRFREIERETRVAARFHHRSRRDAAALDAAVTIANRLTLVFREAGQFDEEEECLRKLRWWNRKLSFRRARNRYHLWPGLALLAYAEWMISSLGWLLLSVAGWMLLMALVWWTWTMDAHSWEAAVKGTLEAFIGSGIETDQGPGIVFLSSFSAMLGFFHLGVFVSYLYSAIARK